MDRTTAPNYATVAGKRVYVDEDLIGGIAGTQLKAADGNGWQEEILGLIESAGIVASAGNLKQAVQGVKRLAGANVGSVITANATLTADNAGLVVVNATSGSITLTLPLSAAAGGAPCNVRIVRIDGTANTVTTAFAGADGLLFGGPVTVAPNQVLHVGASGGTTWVNFFENAPASLVAAAGWERKPSGIIEQWAQGATVTGNGDAVTFPIAFPTACSGVVINERNGAGWAPFGGATLYAPSGANTTGFTLYAKNVASGGALTLPGSPIAYYYQARGW